MQQQSEYTAIVFMGVSGTGKSRLSRTIATNLSMTYVEADDYHPTSNFNALNNNNSLTGGMRRPWLVELSKAVEEARQQGHVVVSCSALKRVTRDLMRTYIQRTYFVCLYGDRKLIAERLRKRRNHFVSPDLVDGQLALMELPETDEEAVFIDSGAAPDLLHHQVEEVVKVKFLNVKPGNQ